MVIALAIASIAGPVMAAATSSSAATGIVSFARAKWDAGRWTPIRLSQQKTLKTFTQRDESIGPETFTAEEIKASLYHVLLMTDTGTTEGEFEVVFSLSEDKGTAPGVFLAPVVKDGVLDTSIAVFVAAHTMAIWTTQVDPATGATKYKHLVRLNRWSEPNRKHVLRCRYSQARNAVILRLDQSDPILIRDLGVKLNSLIGIWGSEGLCDFYSVTFSPKPELDWTVSDPNKK